MFPIETGVKTGVKTEVKLLDICWSLTKRTKGGQIAEGTSDDLTHLRPLKATSGA